MSEKISFTQRKSDSNQIYYLVSRYSGKDKYSQMKRTVVLTGKAVVNFRKVINDAEDYDVDELLASNDLREAQIDGDDLLDIEWIHDDVSIEVIP